MHTLSTGRLLVAAAAISFVAGSAGATLALWIDTPDEVVIERVIEIPERTIEPPTTVSRADVSLLRDRYVAVTGQNEEWTYGLIEEIAATVCDGGVVDDVQENLGPDIVMSDEQLAGFVDEVREACPES